MSTTLTYNDSVTRIGYTKIEGEIAMQHTCTISTDNPNNMNFNSSVINQELYKQNRETCRADRAEFEDAAYALQEEYLAKESKEETK